MQIIVLAACSYALFQVLAAYAAQKLSDAWFVIGGTVAVVLITGIIGASKLMHDGGLGKYTTSGLVLLFFANLGVTTFAWLLGKSFQQYDAKFVIPVVFGGAILLSTVATAIISRSVPTMAQVAGLLLVSSGLVVLGMQGK
jgi:hypothetical protein